MIHSKQLDWWYAHIHRLVLLVTEVLSKEEMVLVVSGFLVKRGTIPHESAILDEEEEMVMSSCALDVIWCSWGLFS